MMALLWNSAVREEMSSLKAIYLALHPLRDEAQTSI
jgi:hypothetical protein